MDKVSAFGDRLIRERKRWKLTQLQMGKMAGVSTQTISSYEKGTKTPSLENAIAIAEKLELSLDEMCGMQNSAYSIHSFTDAVRTLNSFIQYVSGELFFQFGTDEDENNSSSEIRIPFDVCAGDTTKVRAAMRDWEKMVGLYHSGIISQDIYVTWFTTFLKEMSSFNVAFADVKTQADEYLRTIDQNL